MDRLKQKIYSGSQAILEAETKAQKMFKFAFLTPSRVSDSHLVTLIFSWERGFHTVRIAKWILPNAETKGRRIQRSNWVPWWDLRGCCCWALWIRNLPEWKWGRYSKWSQMYTRLTTQKDKKTETSNKLIQLKNYSIKFKNRNLFFFFLV